MECLFRDHSSSKYAEFSEKRTFLTPWYAHVRMRINHSSISNKSAIYRPYYLDNLITLIMKSKYKKSW